MGKVIDRDAFDIDGPTQCRNHFADIDREAFELGPAAKGGGCRDLANQGGRGHLARGHAINGIVDEECADLFAAGRSMDDLGGTDGSQVTIALVGEDQIVRVDTLDAGGNSRSPAMGRLDHVTGKILVIVVGATDWRDTDCRIQNAHLDHDLGDQAMDDAMRTAGTIMERLVSQACGAGKDLFHVALLPASWRTLSRISC